MGEMGEMVVSGREVGDMWMSERVEIDLIAPCNCRLLPYHHSSLSYYRCYRDIAIGIGLYGRDWFQQDGRLLSSILFVRMFCILVIHMLFALVVCRVVGLKD